MDGLFNGILTNTSVDLTFGSAMLTMLLAVVFGLVIGFTYYKTQTDCFQRSMAVTLLMLPVILSVIILFVGSNIARAFSMAGTLSIVRFRSAPGDMKDIGFIFFAVAAGLACGVGLYGSGAVFVVLLCAVMLVSEKIGLFRKKTVQKSLRITIPENLNYEGAFDEILEKYTGRCQLSKIRTTDLGALFELCYDLEMRSGADEKAMLDEIRCRNGNLSVILTLAAPVTVKQ